MPQEVKIHRYEPGHGKGGEYMGMEEQADGHWCAWDDVQPLVAAADAAEKAAAMQRLEEATGLLRRIGKYCVEDRAVTPRATRLARVLVEVDDFLAGAPAREAAPGPGDAPASPLGRYCRLEYAQEWQQRAESAEAKLAAVNGQIHKLRRAREVFLSARGAAYQAAECDFESALDDMLGRPAPSPSDNRDRHVIGHPGCSITAGRKEGGNG